MKYLNNFIFFFIILFMAACSSEDDNTIITDEGIASMEIEFDNIITQDGFERQLKLRTAADSSTFDFKNELGQSFNLAALKYYISELKILGEAAHSVPMNASPTNAEGYYLIDEAIGLNLVSLDSIPFGNYTGISFKVGIDEATINEGVQGGVLDPVAHGLFWNWNSGYIFLQMEGYSDSSKGAASGRIVPKSGAGLVYHVGGWRTIPDNPKMVNNVQQVTLNFDNPLQVVAGSKPHIHLTFDVSDFIGDTDFSVTSSIHSPSAGKALAEQISAAFAFDHIHK